MTTRHTYTDEQDYQYYIPQIAGRGAGGVYRFIQHGILQMTFTSREWY